MSKYCDETALFDLDSGDGEDSLLECSDSGIRRVGLISGGQSLVPAPPTETRTNAQQDDACDTLASSSATASQNADFFSPDLVDTYFRQMGDAEWLARDEEIALAKRIEGSQQAMLVALCGVPMVAERIGGWGHEVAEGRFRLADLVELSFSGVQRDAPVQTNTA
jgi:Sigma-70 factor, region 1.2